MCGVCRRAVCVVCVGVLCVCGVCRRAVCVWCVGVLYASDVLDRLISPGICNQNWFKDAVFEAVTTV